MFFALYSNNKDYDEVYIQNYAKINLVPKLQRVKGVGQVNVGGYSMRIWIDPEKMSSYNIAPKDVQDALREQNVEAAGKMVSIYEYVIKYKGRLSEVKDYENIIIKSKRQFLEN
jgi:HAE1 family hydrophobic/amphiphilic exporter-1